MHTIEVHNSHIGTTDHQRLAHDQTQPSRAARDHADSVLQAEARQCPLEVEAAPALHRSRAGQVLFFGVLDADGVVGTRELALVLEGARLAGCAVLIVVIRVVVLAGLLPHRHAIAEGADGQTRRCGERGWADGGGGRSRQLSKKSGFDHACGLMAVSAVM